ncbi:MAG: two-component system, LuxR family, sensor kinase FixL [Chthoniobacter sp.]|jgi:PAS domain S-box-containing protein|nr:two-component system, LuxR family, sensor kinase FixL [Chthoniobacter sp.]
MANVNLKGTRKEVSAAGDSFPGRAERSERLDGDYRLFFESNPQPMWFYDAETLRFVDVNRAAMELYGYSVTEFLRMTIEDIRPAEDISKIRATVAHRRADFQQSGIWRHIKKNGELLQVQISSHELPLDGRRVIFVQAVDVTERCRMEAELRASEEQFRATVEQANVGLARIAPDGCFLHVNDRLCEIVGHPREKLLQMRFQDITHSDDLTSNLTLIDRARRGEVERYRIEKRYLRSDASTVWTSVRARVVRRENGEPDYLIAVIEDISERKAAEEALQASRAELEQRVATRTAELQGLNETLSKENAERRNAESALAESRELLRTTLDSLPAQIAVLNAEGKILIINKVWEAFAEANPGIMPAVGDNYLTSAGILGGCGAPAGEAMSGVRCVLSGSLAEFSFEFPCHMESVERWFTLRVAPLSPENRGAVVVHADVTAQHRARVALRESHALLRDIIEGTTDAIYIKDLEGRYMMMNIAGAGTLGLAPADVIGKSTPELFEPEVSREILEQDMKVVTAGKTLTFSYSMRLHGQDRDLLATKGLCHNEAGEIIGIFGITRDITELRRANEALAHERNLLRTLIDNLPDSIFVKDTESRFLLNNAAHLRLLRASTPEEVFGKTDFDCFAPEAAQHYFDDEQVIFASGQPMIDRVETVVNAGGETRWLSTTKVPVRDGAGEIIGLVGINHDITERRLAEQHFVRFASIVESSNDAIISTDVAGKVLSWNKAAERIFGYTAEEMSGQSPAILSPPERREEARELQERVRSGESLKNLQAVRQTKDGRLIDIAVTVSPITDETGKVAGASSIVRDITDQKRLEREVLEIVDLEKRRIGQDLHDDLCQYLVGISLLANVLHDNLKKKHIAEAEDALQINELVRQAVAKARSITKGLAPLELAGSGLMNALDELAMTVQRLFNIDSTFSCPAPVEIADPSAAAHLYRIAQEATHNAAKHCKGDSVTIRLLKTNEGIVLSVEDNGVGCGENGPPPSSGLGLHTMQYRARVIGATLEYLPNETGGTTVRCSLPSRKQSGSQAENVR